MDDLKNSINAHLRRKPGLNQQKLAEEIELDPAVISAMLHGKRLSGPQARKRLRDIIKWLHREKALESVEEANNLLTTAGMVELSVDDPEEAMLLQSLKVPAGLQLSQTQRTSPFIVGPPIVHPRYFFGRERLLRRVFRLLESAPLQNCAIIGGRKSGKTSLLHYIGSITHTPPEELRLGQTRDWIINQERYTFIFVDCRSPQVAGTKEALMRHLLSELNASIPEPWTLRAAFGALIESIRSPTVILLDDVDYALVRYSDLDQEFWESLRSVAQTDVRGSLGFVLSSREAFAQVQSLSASSPLFNTISFTATLDNFTKEEALELIKSSPIPFPEPDVEWILDKSQCQPMWLQILCRERLFALEMRDPGDSWRIEALEAISQSPSVQ